ncbi:MAG: hypothetical protein ABIP71_13290 [Verrucomicrobiota bacterium]
MSAFQKQFNLTKFFSGLGFSEGNTSAQPAHTGLIFVYRANAMLADPKLGD